MELDVLSLITVPVLKIDIKKSKSNIGMDCKKMVQTDSCVLSIKCSIINESFTLSSLY